MNHLLVPAKRPTAYIFNPDVSGVVLIEGKGVI